jgi:homoserine kinase
MTQRSVTVRVPATSANLGPGFDCLGVALDWTGEVRLTVADAPLPRPEGPVERMAVTAALALYTHAAVAPPAGITATYTGDIPVGRGLGLSAAARVAGLLAADALLDGGAGGHDVEVLLPLAVQLERHGDNAAPALLGGLQVVVVDDDGVVHVGVEPPADLVLALLIPEFSMPTEETRAQLPERVTRNQAVHNIGRAALLLGALAQRRYDLLRTATEDVLHQPARATIFTAMYPIFQAARDAGAHGVYLSGGGPTIAAFVTGDPADVAGAMREAAAARGVQATTRICRLSPDGARIVARD